FPGMQGGPMMHSIAAKAVAFHEAMQPEFRQYTKAIIANAKALAGRLMEKGWRLVSGGTDNHLLLVDLRSRLPEMTGKEAAALLDSVGIVCNMNAIPFDPRGVMTTSGIRLGTPAVTTRGLDENQMIELADWIDKVLMTGGKDPDVLSGARGFVAETCRNHPVPNHNL
ncbi:MAG: serine hydroxymethyltransferase, partial [Phycisphaerae bacterium]|nr:serine hydroxymethyltransferase [Phycisphaerae bacterium]